MPDGGVSTNKGPVPVTAFSSPQWQSFEMRMRNRRAERCLERAHVALEAGRLDDSTEAFEEAQQLNPAGAGMLEFAQQLSAAKAPVPPTPDRRLRRFAAIAAILLALSGWIGWWTFHRPGEMPRAAQSRADIRLGTDAPADKLPAQQASTVADLQIPEAPAPATLPTISATRDPAVLNRAPVERPALDPPSNADAGSTGTAGLDVAARKTESAPSPREIAARPPDPLPATEFVLPPSTTVPSAPAAPPLSPVNSRASTATAPVPPAATPSDQRPAIRATLGRYEAAYSALDVAAVQAVWPALDQRALARAFGSLASQRVSLENCNVDVDGGSARANCSGTAAWTPKVGGGLRTTARNWVFDLSQSEGTWQIVRVQAR